MIDRKAVPRAGPGRDAVVRLERPGDITRADTDAVVNAANPALIDGDGVAGAIFRAVRERNGGEDLLADACARIPIIEDPGTRPREWRGQPVRCETGDARVTPSFGIGGPRTRFIIHAVGPNAAFYPATGEEGRRLLERAYRRSLRLAEERLLETVAFPALSGGIYGYSADAGARPAVSAVERFLKTSESVKEIVFLFLERDSDNYDAFRRALAEPPDGPTSAAATGRDRKRHGRT